MNVKSRPLVTTCILFCFLSLSIPAGVLASTSPTVTLTFHKRFGFAAFSEMTGAFTAVASVSPDVVHVEFYLDSLLKLNDTSAPFQWEFDTSNYSLGPHHFDIIAYNNASGSAHASKDANFVEGPFPPYFAMFLAFTLIIVAIVVGYKAIIVLPRKRKTGN